MTGTRLVLVRHAQSRSNAEGVIGGHLGCRGLSELGVAQAGALAARLAASGELAGTAAVYASVLPRAVETAAIVAGALGGLPVEQTCDLCEQHPGECDGMTWTDYEAAYGTYRGRQTPHRPLSPGGESWAELTARAGRTLPGIAERHAGELVVAVTHGGLVEASIVHLLALADYGAGAGFRCWNASISEWEHDGRRWALARFNDTAHLFAAGVEATH